MFRRGVIAWVAALTLATLPTLAFGGGYVIQDGNITPGHAPAFSAPNVVQDGGTPTTGKLTSLGIWNSGSCSFGITDTNVAANPTAPYHLLCLGTNSTGGGVLSYGAYNGASALPLTCIINGTVTSCLGGGGGSPVGPVYSIQYNNGGVFGGTGPGAASYVLTSNGPGLAPTFQPPSGAGAVSSVSGTAGQIIVSPTTGATIVSLPSTITSNETFSGTSNFTGAFNISGNTMTFPASPASLLFKVGSFTNGDCLEASGTVGGVSDAGAACGSGGGGGSAAHTQDFLAGTNFTPGTTTSLTLSSAPVSANSLVITFDGVTQSHDTWSLSTQTVTFNVAIPLLTQVVEAQWLTTSIGGGTVTSVGLFDNSTVPIYTITNSPVTTSGTLTFTLTTETANTVFAGPSSGSAAQPGFRALVGADIPNPTATTLGGIKSIVATTHEWIDSISTGGAPHQSQPAFTDISGAVTGAQMLALATGDVYQGNGSNVAAAVTLSAALDAAFDNTQGDILYRSSTGWTYLGPGTNGYFLETQGSGANPEWAAAAGGSGCTIAGGSQYQIIVNNGAGGCSSSPDATVTLGALVLGASGTAGSVTMGNATSGTIVVQPVTGALGTVTASLPANSGTIAELNLAETWTAAQTFTNSDIKLLGSSTGATTFTSANSSSSNYTLTIPAATGTLLLSALTNTDIFVGNGSNVAVGVAMSGDCTIANTGAITCLDTNGTAFGTAATVNTGSTGGTVPLNNGGFTQSGTANFTSTFEIGGNAMTFPGSAQTLAALGVAQSFTKTQAVTPHTISSCGGTITPDGTSANDYICVLTSNLTLANPSTITAGASFNFRLVQPSSGNYTLAAVGSDYFFPGGTLPVLSTSSNAIDIFSCRAFSSSEIDCFPPGLAMSNP